MRRGLIAACIVLPLAACVQPPEAAPLPAPPPAALGGIDDLRRGAPPPASPDLVRVERFDPSAEAGEMTELRRRALREGAQSYGGQMGYARRAWEIAGRLEARSGQLSSVFDFGRVISEAPVGAGWVLPPVVSRSFDAVAIEDDGRGAAVAEEYLAILQPGVIRPVPPTWRDWLIFDAPTPEAPPAALRPVDAEEERLFTAWFAEGWKAGAALAETELERRLDRLTRDYAGMLQYRRLVALGMMNRMVLADADFGVTGSGDEMRIGSRVVRVVGEAEFQRDPARWRIAPVTERERDIVRAGEIPPLPR